MMIAARRNERSLGSIPLGQLEAQDPAVKCQGAFEIGDLEVNMPDTSAEGDRSDRGWR
jgi:hypothetical protein